MSKKYEIIFKLNNKDKLIVQLKEPFTIVHCCYEVPIVLIEPNNQIILSNDSLKENMHILTYLLSKVLQKKLILHKSIKKDIGYLYNQDLAHFYKEEAPPEPDLIYIKTTGVNCWIGEKYDLWGYDSIMSWLYNDANGSIIFEITPVYPGGFGDPGRKAKAGIAYKEWLKTYKPYYICEIPHATAAQWLEQAQVILNQIEKNIAK